MKTVKPDDEKKPEPAETDAPALEPQAVSQGLPLGLLGVPLTTEPKDALDWPKVAEELRKVLPAEILAEHDWLPPARLVDIAVRQCPGLLLELSPESLNVVRVARLADVLSGGTWKNGKGRAVDQQRLRALWSSEPARDITFTPDIDAAVWDLSENAERIESPLLDVAQAIVSDPEQFIGDDEDE